MHTPEISEANNEFGQEIRLGRRSFPLAPLDMGPLGDADPRDIYASYLLDQYPTEDPNTHIALFSSGDPKIQPPVTYVLIDYRIQEIEPQYEPVDTGFEYALSVAEQMFAGADPRGAMEEAFNFLCAQTGGDQALARALTEHAASQALDLQRLAGEGKLNDHYEYDYYMREVTDSKSKHKHETGGENPSSESTKSKSRTQRMEFEKQRDDSPFPEGIQQNAIAEWESAYPSILVTRPGQAFAVSGHEPRRRSLWNKLFGQHPQRESYEQEQSLEAYAQVDEHGAWAKGTGPRSIAVATGPLSMHIGSSLRKGNVDFSLGRESQSRSVHMARQPHNTYILYPSQPQQEKSE